MRRVAKGLVLVLGALGACGEATEARTVVTGLIDATEIDVASKIPGRIKDLAVREGDTVEAGQTLVTLESEEIQAKIEQVTAAIEAAQAKLKLARNGARNEEKAQARRALDAARHQVEIAKKMFDRMNDLVAKGSISRAVFDDAEFKFNVSKDQLAIAEARWEMVRNGAREEEIEALEALVRQGEGTLSEVRSYGKEQVQTAPLAAEVSKIILHPGELAATGYPIVTLVDLKDLWATFAVREDLLKQVRPGTRIQGEVPALGRTVAFEVFRLAPMGDFATWKATSEKNRFDLKSFEVKARPVEPVEGLRPGMTVRWAVE